MGISFSSCTAAFLLAGVQTLAGSPTLLQSLSQLPSGCLQTESSLTAITLHRDHFGPLNPWQQVTTPRYQHRQRDKLSRSREMAHTALYGSFPAVHRVFTSQIYHRSAVIWCRSQPKGRSSQQSTSEQCRSSREEEPRPQITSFESVSFWQASKQAQPLCF